jgi:sulfur carrier protein
LLVVVNGTERELADGSTVADALAAIDAPPQGIAVALDGEVVRRADWAGTVLPPGGSVEVLTAVQGG